MPTISMFYGILIRMFLKDNTRHNLPHIHIKYQEYNAVYSLDGELIDGQLPPKKAKMVEVWIDLHYDELMADWELAVNGELPFKIDPLK